MTPEESEHELARKRLRASDEAFRVGVFEAMKRKSGLIFATLSAPTRLKVAHVCAYPPADVTEKTVVAWLSANHPELGDSFNFLPPADVDHAVRDFRREP